MSLYQTNPPQPLKQQSFRSDYIKIERQLQDALDFFEGTGPYTRPIVSKQGRSIVTIFSGQRFATKKLLRDKVRRILWDEKNLTTPLSGLDETIIRYIFSQHPRYEEMTNGLSVYQIWVREVHKKNRHFVFELMDGTIDYFSYQKCFFFSERTEFMAECRQSISQWIKVWREKNAIPDGFHVHHKAPATFSMIAEEFGELTNWVRPVDNLAFIQFHADRADLEGLPAEAHQSLHSRS